MEHQDTRTPVYNKAEVERQSIWSPGITIGEKQVGTSTTISASRAKTLSTRSSSVASSTTASGSTSISAAPPVAGTETSGLGGLKPPGSLSEGVKAGIGAGVGIGVSAFIAVGALLWFLNRKRKSIEVKDSKYASIAPSPPSQLPAYSAGPVLKGEGAFAPVVEKGQVPYDPPVEMSATAPKDLPVELA